MNFFGIGGFEFLVIALVAFLVLGPRKMAEAGKTLAKIMSELRRQRDELTTALLDEPERPRRDAGPAGKSPGVSTGGQVPGQERPGGGGASRADDDFPGYRPPGTSPDRPTDRPTDRTDG